MEKELAEMSAVIVEAFGKGKIEGRKEVIKELIISMVDNDIDMSMAAQITEMRYEDIFKIIKKRAAPNFCKNLFSAN